MSEPANAPPRDDEPLTPTPARSRWGRKVATGYLVVIGIAFALLAVELWRGEAGLGGLAISVLTAPWSALLAPLARFLAPRMPMGGLRVLGLALGVLTALLNARILYGIAARAERDVRGRR